MRKEVTIITVFTLLSSTSLFAQYFPEDGDNYLLPIELTIKALILGVILFVISAVIFKVTEKPNGEGASCLPVLLMNAAFLCVLPAIAVLANLFAAVWIIGIIISIVYLIFSRKK